MNKAKRNDIGMYLASWILRLFKYNGHLIIAYQTIKQDKDGALMNAGTYMRGNETAIKSILKRIIDQDGKLYEILGSAVIDTMIKRSVPISQLKKERQVN